MISDRMRDNTLVDCEVRPSALGDDSGLLGAMALGLLALYQEHGVEAGQLDGMPEAAKVAEALSSAPQAVAVGPAVAVLQLGMSLEDQNGSSTL